MVLPPLVLPILPTVALAAIVILCLNWEWPELGDYTSLEATLSTLGGLSVLALSWIWVSGQVAGWLPPWVSGQGASWPPPPRIGFVNYSVGVGAWLLIGFGFSSTRWYWEAQRVSITRADRRDYVITPLTERYLPLIALWVVAWPVAGLTAGCIWLVRRSGAGMKGLAWVLLRPYERLAKRAALRERTAAQLAGRETV
jgi:hypothetical protein